MLHEQLFSFVLSFFICYLPAPIVGITFPGTYNLNVFGTDPCRGDQTMDQDTGLIYKGGPTSNLWLKHRQRTHMQF